MSQFEPFQKIARLTREVTITEKIDGTNGCIFINEDGEFKVGSRTRWLDTTTGDNHGFMLWALQHKEELMKLGPGRHFGEWWGSGIQRGYGLGEKRFSLFNTHKWVDAAVRPACCAVVPIIVQGIFNSALVDTALELLRINGSVAAPGFAKPEGIIIYHSQGNVYFKKTLDKDEEWKGKQA